MGTVEPDLALRRVPRPMWLGSAPVAVVVTGVIWALLAGSLAEAFSQTLIPAAFGCGGGLVGGLCFMSWKQPSFTKPLRHSLYAFSIAAIAVSLVLFFEPLALTQMRRYAWMPVLAGAGLFVWGLAFFSERRKGQRIGAMTAVLAGLAAASAVLHNSQDMYQALNGQYVRAWNVYHYYLGSKYFAELGYFDLYAATLAADDACRSREREACHNTEQGAAVEDTANGFQHIRRTRDMYSYREISRKEAVEAFDRTVFSEARWDSFVRDTRLIRRELDAQRWERVLLDLGYNPAPPWTAMAGRLANWIPLDSPAMRLLVNSDIPLNILIFVALWYAFGLRTAATAMLWMNVVPFNRGRFAGGFLQYDWLASAILSVALYYRGKPRAAGLTLAWGAMTRGFIALLIVPLAVRYVAALIRKRGDHQPSRHQTRARFLVAFAACCTVIAALSLMNPRGADAWAEWVDKISLHSHWHPATSGKRIGVGRLAMHRPEPEHFWAARPFYSEDSIQDSRAQKLMLQAIGLVFLVLALVKRNDLDSMILMLFAIFIAATTSRYYASIWILLFALGAQLDSRPIRWQAALAGAVLFGIATWYAVLPTHSARYLLINYQVYAMFILLCAAYVVGDWKELVNILTKKPEKVSCINGSFS